GRALRSRGAHLARALPVATSERAVRRLLGAALALLLLLFAFVLARALLAPLERPDVVAVEPDSYRVDADAVARRLAGALRFQTISPSDAPLDEAAFAGLRAYLAKTWPRTHAKLAPERIGGNSLLYTWRGRAENEPALLLAAHQDVVPVVAPEQWQHPPFEG